MCVLANKSFLVLLFSINLLQEHFSSTHMAEKTKKKSVRYALRVKQLLVHFSVS